MSLVNVDVKIITKALAKREWEKYCLVLFIKIKSVCNIHNLIDIIKYAHTKNIQPAILFLDQEKAFDRVNHDFLIKTLSHFNFGEYFTN